MSTHTAPLSPVAASGWRLVWLDLARGLAVLAMVIYHLGWDLSFLGLAAIGLRDNEGWQVFGHLIAASFLVLVGVSLVLAQGTGFDALRFLKRLGMIVGSALLVTLVTYVATPDQFIFFGILHHIALASVLALPFLRVPLWGLIAAAGLAFVLPRLLAGEALSLPALSWLGLGTSVPDSSDFVPLLPWFGFVLAGMALARAFDLRRPGEAQGSLARGLAYAGRHSLIIYMLHQPILYGGLWLFAQAAAPPPDPQRQSFMAACTRECGANGGELMRCNAICTCAVESLKAEKLWTDVMAGKGGEETKTRMNAISTNCARKAATGASGVSR